MDSSEKTSLNLDGIDSLEYEYSLDDKCIDLSKRESPSPLKLIICMFLDLHSDSICFHRERTAVASNQLFVPIIFRQKGGTEGDMGCAMYI